MTKQYWIDGEAVDWSEVIQMARRLGYEPGFLALTSEASQILRDNGYRVSNHPDEEP